MTISLCSFYSYTPLSHTAPSPTPPSHYNDTCHSMRQMEIIVSDDKKTRGISITNTSNNDVNVSAVTTLQHLEGAEPGLHPKGFLSSAGKNIVRLQHSNNDGGSDDESDAGTVVSIATATGLNKANPNQQGGAYPAHGVSMAIGETFRSNYIIPSLAPHLDTSLLAQGMAYVSTAIETYWQSPVEELFSRLVGADDAGVLARVEECRNKAVSTTSLLWLNNLRTVYNMRAAVKEVITDYIHISDYVSKYRAHKDPSYILKRERTGKFFLFHKYVLASLSCCCRPLLLSYYRTCYDDGHTDRTASLHSF